MKTATPIERRLVLAAKLRPRDPSSNWALLSRLPSGTDPEQFAAAVAFVLHATPSFCQTFTLTDRGEVMVTPTNTRAPVPVVGYGDVGEIQAAAARYGDCVYDPSRAPLYHAEVATAGGEAYLVFAGAHVCSDGFGFYNLVKDFAAHYADPTYAPPDVDRASSETQRSSRAEAVNHFHSVFTGVDNLQVDGWGKRDAHGRIPGAIVRTPLPSDNYSQCHTLADNLGVRRYSVLVTALAVVAGCLASTSRIAVATPMANRRAGHQSETTRGVRVNSLPLRFDLTPDRTVADLIQNADDQLKGLIRHEQHAFSDFSRSIFRSQTMDSTQPSVSFTLYPQPLAVVIDDARGQPLGVDRRYLQYPLTIAVEVTRGEATGSDGDRNDGMTLIIERADFLPQCDIAALFTHVLRQVVESRGSVTVDAVDWTPPGGPSSLVPVRRRFAVHTIADEVATMVRRAPDALAVVTDDRRVTYRELDAMSSNVARWIRQQTTAPAIAVAIGPSVELVATVLGLLRSGVVYIPIDGTPTTRIAQISEVCDDPPILVPAGNPEGVSSSRVLELPHSATDSSAQEVAAGSRLAEPGPRPDETAYILFTSGTTGTPKGVMITHAAAARFFNGLREAIGDGRRRWLQSHSPTFDISLVEIFGALTSGGSVCVPRPGAQRDPRYLGDFIRRHGVEIVSQTPSAFALLAPSLIAAESVAAVLFCGERLEVPSVVDFVSTRPDVLVMNCYGTTETSMYHTSHRVSVGDAVAQPLVGAPFPDVSMAVIDEAMRTVPVGVAGQIAVGGDGLMHGYVGDPVLTARQIQHVAGEPMYLTGDRGAMTADGVFSVSGRMDNQIKIRGHRCEPGEIENALHRTGLVNAVRVHIVGQGLTARLVFFVVLAAETTSVSAVRSALRPYLPRYFEPDVILPLDAIPMTVNGKVDVGHLAQLAHDAFAKTQNDTTTAAATASRAGAEPPPDVENLEDVVCGVWAEVLGTSDFTPTTNFFDAGGTSAMVLQVGDRLRKRVKVTGIDVVDLFEHHTPAALAQLLNERRDATSR